MSTPSAPRIQSIGARTGDVADGPVTTEHPVLTVADGRVHVREVRGATVVRLDGGLDDAFAAEVQEAIVAATAGADAVIVDLDRVTLLEPEALGAVLRHAGGPDAARCVVAPRLSGRMVLDRWGASGEHAVFTSIADALQARTFAADGYGRGWSPG